LSDHPHRTTGHGLLCQRRRPFGLTEESDPTAGPPRQLPGRRSRGAVEDAGIDLLTLAEPDEQDLRRLQPRRSQQRDALVSLAGLAKSWLIDGGSEGDAKTTLTTRML